MAAFLLVLAAAARQLGRRRGRREAEDAFDMPDDVFRHFRLRKETVRWLCDEVAEELGGVRSTALSVERQVLCALRFFATGSFQGSVGSEETIGVTQPAVRKCVRRVAEAIVHAGTRNKWVHYPRTSEEKAAVKEGFLRRGGIPGVISCVDGSLIAIIAPKGDNKASYMCRKGFYALNSMFICDAGMRILAVDALRPGSDHDAHVWRTTWLRRRFQEGHIAKAGEHLLGDSGYPLEPWLLTPVPGHPPAHTAEGRYNTAHASMRSVVERCIGLLKSRFRCLQRYRALHYEPERAANIVAACAVLHNLCLDEGDSAFDEVDDDDSSNSNSDEANGGPLPLVVPRARAARIMYLKGCAARDNVITLFGTTRQQHQHYLRRRLRRQQHRQQQ
ncbi:putative nuclease HARBI1 [Dermacentor silvarum]|uniref:putative nuclease HARBI1 n=1 Tax=Dermacentor silvarum TaxID=543639 RepID=UPI002100CEFE|nr:putative nuclease HARBI1 [Dermacentor silvarum]